MQSAVPKVLPIQKQDAVLVYIQHKRAFAMEKINQHIIQHGLQNRRQLLYQALDDQILPLLLPERCDEMYQRSLVDQSIKKEKQILKQARLRREKEKISEGKLIAKMWKDYQLILDKEGRTSLQSCDSLISNGLLK
jgi:hypothetical protein